MARYGVALILALASLIAARLLEPEPSSPVYAILVGAIAVAIWYGGPGPALVSLVLAWSLAPVVLYTDPRFSFSNREDAFPWTIALAVALLVIWVSVVMRRGQQRAATAASEAEESSRQMETLQALGAALSAAVTPTDVAHALVDRTPGLVGARGGALGLLEGDELVIVDPAGVPRQTHRPGLRLPLSTLAPITRAAAEGTLQRAEDRKAFEERYPDGAALTTYAQAALAVPLRVGEDVVGSMSFLFDDPQLAHEEAEAITLIAADLGGQALERARLYDRERNSRRALDRILRVAPRLYFGTPEEVSVAICREARRTLDADLTEIWRVDADWLWLELVCRDPDDEELSPDDRLEIARLPGLRTAVESLEVTFVPDAEEHLEGDLLAYVRRLGIRSWLWAPIVVAGRAERLLFFSWQTIVPQPDPSTIVLARRFSDQAGLALEQLERRQAEEEAERAALETRRLLDTTAALSAAATPAEVTAAILREGIGSLGAIAGVVVGRMEEEGDLEILDAQGYQPAGIEPWRRIRIDARTPLSEAVREDRVIVIESPEELEAQYPTVAGTRVEDTGSWLVVPLSAGGSVIGAAGFSFADPRHFSRADLEFAEALARQSGQALERALLLAAEYAARTRAEDMVVLASALSQAVSPSDVLQAVAGQVLSLLRAARVCMYVVDGGSTLDLVGDVGGSGELADELRHFPLDEPTVAAEVARRNESIWLEDRMDWEPFSDARHWVDADIERAGAVPLHVDGRLVGVLVVGLSREAPIDPNTRRLIESVARQATQPLERAWLMDREQAARVAAEVASRRTRRLQSVTQAIAAAPARRDVADIVIHEALAAVSGDAAALFAFDAGQEAPELLAQVGLDDVAVARGLTAAVTEASLAGSLLVIDASSPAGMQESTIGSAITAAGFEGAACVPLAVGTRVLGSLLLCFRSPHPLAEEDVALLQTLARIAAQALERGRLFDDEQRLRLRAEQIQRMTASLSGSLTQKDVANVVVETLAETMGVDAVAVSIVLADRQVMRTLAWHGYREDVVAASDEVSLQERARGAREARRPGLSFYPTAREMSVDFPELAEVARSTGHESFLLVPLVAGEATTGLISMSWTGPVTLAAEDGVFIETLASQAAQALDRAHRYESERTIAETLQRSVLPVSLPHVDGIQLAARYLPGTEEVDVGGDWFDAVVLPNGRLGIAVGDVVGKGVQSAATMAQLRNALRAFVLDQMKPSSTIARLNRLTDELPEPAFATVVYAVLDPGSGVCRFTSAGHPPPLVLYPDGHATFLEGGRGLPLGTGADAKYGQAVVELPAGSTLLLYTDGLVERRGEAIDEGLERLRLAAESARGEPETLVEQVLDQLIGRAARGDDIAVLAVRVLALAPRPLVLRLPAERRSLEVVRDCLRTWLQSAPATQAEAHEIVLASWEACANAIEHPSGPDDGWFHVTAELESSAVRVSVRDSGAWLPETERSDRGLGLRLIRSVMSSVDIEATEEGTLVRLEKRLADEDVPAT